MRMVDLIIKKRCGFPLSDEEIKFWINGYVTGDIADYQSSAMTMAILFKGMNKHEIAVLTDVMKNSGDVVDLSSIKGIKVDKHSTGGVGDKTSLVLGPMVVACGAKMAKMSGRGLGHTGGTLDKLESIPGLSVSETIPQMIKQVNDIGIAIIGQTLSLVPADKKLYALRDVTGTVEAIPLIASSIMSKKLASGTDTILLDVTVGEGAFMKNMKSAEELAKTMVNIGKSFNKNTIAVLSNMSEPLGNAVGNNLEIKEVIDALKGNGPKDLMELCYTSGSIMLMQAKICNNKNEAKQKLMEVINNGKAYDTFLKMVKSQGGDIAYIENPQKFPICKNVYEVKAPSDGYIKSLNALSIGVSAMKLGAGREKLEDIIDPAAGIVLSKKVGDKCFKGETLCTLYTNKENYNDVIEEVLNSYVITNLPIKKRSVIRKIVC